MQLICVDDVAQGWQPADRVERRPAQECLVITPGRGSQPKNLKLLEIQIIDEKNASGVWAMDDIVELPGLLLQGWGHYHESYRKEEGVWKIARIKLTRLRLLQNGEEQTV